MKQVLLLALIAVAAASCKEGWNDEYKAQYRQQCLQENSGLYATQTQTEAYCDCNLEAVMKRYPHPSDIIENKDSAAVRKALEDCSLAAQQK